MARRLLEIGLVSSRSGSYRWLAETARSGVRAAVQLINADPDAPLTIRVHEADPAGRADGYAPCVDRLCRTTGLRHLFGAITSASRKEVIPVLERHGATLWFGAPCEGFETADTVAYMHSTVNQNVLPLLDWALPALGRRAFLAGSNYVWGWEIARVARMQVTAAGGEILGDRTVALGDTDVAALADEVRRAAPDFVLNSLVGESQHAFLRALRQHGCRIPVLSCNFTEAEIAAVGDAAEGLISVGPYFAGVGPAPIFANSFQRAAFLSVMTLVDLLGQPGCSDDMTLPQLLSGGCGPLDPATHHRAHPVHIARVQRGRFNPILSLPMIEADPYLSRPPTPGPAARRSHLQVVR